MGSQRAGTLSAQVERLASKELALERISDIEDWLGGWLLFFVRASHSSRRLTSSDAATANCDGAVGAIGAHNGQRLGIGIDG